MGSAARGEGGRGVASRPARQADRPADDLSAFCISFAISCVALRPRGRGAPRVRACGGRRLRDGTRRRRDPWADVLRLIRTRPPQLVPPSAQCLFTRSKHVSIGAWVCPTDGVWVRPRPAFWTRPGAAGLGVIPACLQAVRRCVRAGSRYAQPPSERAVRRETKARTARARPTIPSQAVRRPPHARRALIDGSRPDGDR